MKKYPALSALLIALSLVAILPAQAQQKLEVEENVVYGMYSGLALLMDIYQPVESNGASILLINGSSWHSGLDMAARPLKAGYGYMDEFRDALLAAGYVVFSINHRAAPRFRYPDAVEDTKRAVQFARSRMRAWGMDPSLIGSFGHSSGGHLASMVGVLDDDIANIEDDPVTKESFKVAAVVSIAGPMDLNLSKYAANNASGSSLVAWMGERPLYIGEDRELSGSYLEASPATHASVDDAAFLIIHGTGDVVVPFGMATTMQEALVAAGVESKLVQLDADHAPEIDAQLIVDWFSSILLPN